MQLWLTLLSKLAQGGYGYYWTKCPDGKKITTWWGGKTPGELPPEGDIYFGVNPSKTPKNKTARAQLADIAAVNTLYAEFDAHGADLDQLLHRIEQIQPRPSVIINSGGGFHVYWLLFHPYEIHDPKELSRLADVQARWIAKVGGDPASKDLARVLRVPGTYNYKYDPPREVIFIWADFGCMYELAELAALLPKIDPPGDGAVHQNKTPAPGGKNGSRWLEQAIQRGHNGARNDTGAWLAMQLRDDGLSQIEAEPILLDYQARVGEGPSGGYTRREALATLKSIFRAPAREPARSRAPRTAPPQPAMPDPEPPEEPPAPEGTTTAPPAGSAFSSDAGQDAEETDEGLPPLTYLEFSKIKEALDLQEMGDADLLAALYRNQVVYDHSEKAWYAWQGHYWKVDATRMVYRMVSRRVAPQYFHAAGEATAKDNNEVAKDLARRAAALRNKKRLDNVLFLAGGHEHLALIGDEWDTEPMLLGCSNGVINLRTGDFRPGKPKDYIRSRSEVEWQGFQANCPTWIKFVSDIFAGDYEMVSFVQRLLGYGITGLTTEHVFPILWGEGRNGKSTLLETLGDVLGNDLATSSQADALMDATRGGGDGPKPFVYALRGKRLVWASESNEGRRINEGLVKQLTGGDRLNVRTLHSKPVEFKPTHLLLLITNHKPHINADGSAIWERVLLIPFTQKFIDNPQGSSEHQRDPYLKEKLKAELPGILAWLVVGCLDWQDAGLRPPKAVVAATSEYREDEDTIALFLGEKVDLGENKSIRASELYKAYAEWCKEMNLAAMSVTAFGTRMKARFKVAHREYGNYYEGVDLERKIPF